MTAGRVLGLFVKEPGRAKTRLAARTSPEWSARLADAFLRDLTDRLARLETRRFLIYAPAEAEAYFARVAAGRFELVPQISGDLGERLATFTGEQLSTGARAVVLLGMDSPNVPIELVERAFRELEHADVVLGPAVDGGYYLVGCAGRLPPIFEGITWSSRRVLAETVARLHDPGWHLAVLPPWYDVDYLEDVQVLRGHLAALHRAGIDPELPRTRELLSLPIPNEYPMFVSVLLTSLPLPFEEAVARVAALGFTHVDVVALTERPASHREALADAGVVVSCAAVGRGLPEGETLDAPDRSLRQPALATMKRQITDAAQLGATCCYLVPGLEASAEALTRFADACTLLAEYAGQRMVRLCVEPIPGRAISRADAMTRWLRGIGHPNLKMLLDVGHCLISGEDPFATVMTCGDQVGYVHFDDNDGQGDLHWPLLTGKLTEETLGQMIGALFTEEYKGGTSLELNPTNVDPERGLSEGKALLERLLSTYY